MTTQERTAEYICYDEDSGGTPRFTAVPTWRSITREPNEIDADWKLRKALFFREEGHIGLPIYINREGKPYGKDGIRVDRTDWRLK